MNIIYFLYLKINICTFFKLINTITFTKWQVFKWTKIVCDKLITIAVETEPVYTEYNTILFFIRWGAVLKSGT